MEPLSDTELAVLVDRYLTGGCGEDERQQLVEYFATDRTREPVLRQLQQRLANADAVPPDTAASLRHFLEHIEQRTNPRTAQRADQRAERSPDASEGAGMVRAPQNRTAHRPLRLTQPSTFPVALWAGWVAAASVVAILGGIMWWRTGHILPTTAPAARQYATVAGQRMTVTLPDSTTVILAPNSQLRVPVDYGADRRDLALQGAAYFDVTPAANRPFTVFAENSSTRVLGTTFAVVAYPRDSTVTVVVRAGKVALSGTGVLTAGDVGTLSASGQGAVRHDEDVRRLLAWTEGTLIFDDASVARVLATLQQWYGVRIYTNNPALDRRQITVTFQGETRTEMLSTLAALLHVTPVERADGVLLVPR